jgi:hypothetical protein
MTPPILAGREVHAVTAGIIAGDSLGPGISSVPKLAGPATYSYSMSFEVSNS